MASVISVWPYSEAPDDIRNVADMIYNALADEDDDNEARCDWIAFIPKELSAFQNGFTVDWEGETPNDGCVVRSFESPQHGGFILAGKFIDAEQPEDE